MEHQVTLALLYRISYNLAKAIGAYVFRTSEYAKCGSTSFSIAAKNHFMHLLFDQCLIASHWYLAI